jgi:hypothetical protein
MLQQFYETYGREIELLDPSEAVAFLEPGVDAPRPAVHLRRLSQRGHVVTVAVGA